MKRAVCGVLSLGRRLLSGSATAGADRETPGILALLMDLRRKEESFRHPEWMAKASERDETALGCGADAA